MLAIKEFFKLSGRWDFLSQAYVRHTWFCLLNCLVTSTATLQRLLAATSQSPSTARQNSPGRVYRYLLRNKTTRRRRIAFKGAIRDFLQSPHIAARSSGPGAIVCKSRATHRALITCKCHVTCHLVRRDSSAIKFGRVEIAFSWVLFYWLNH